MADNKKVYNPSGAVARNCWIAAGIGVLVFLYPLVFPPSTYGLSPTLNLVGILIFLTGLISGFMFKKVANHLDALVAGEGLLAHWTYSTEEWNRFTEAEHIRDRHDKWMLFRMIAIIAVVVGVLFAIFVHDSALLMLGVVGGLILIIAVTAKLSIDAAYRQNRLHPGDVYIGLSGALISRAFHYWKLSAAFLRSASFEEGDPPYIQLLYSSPSGRAQGEYTARFPVPRAHESEARQVIARLNQEIVKLAEDSARDDDDDDEEEEDKKEE